MTSKEEVAAAVAAAREAARGVAAQERNMENAVTVDHGKLVEGETSAKGEDVPVMDMSAYHRKHVQEVEGVPGVAETQMEEETPPLKQGAKMALKETETPVEPAPIVAPAAMQSHLVEEAPIKEVPEAPIKEVHGAESMLTPESGIKPEVAAPITEAAPKEGFNPAAYVRESALGQLDRNKDGVITGDDLVAAAHRYEKLKKRVKCSRVCAAIAAILLIIVIGIWIGIAILAGRVTGGVKVVGGGFYVSRGNGRVVSTGRSLYVVPTPVANKLLGLSPAQLETLETVTFAVSGQPVEVQMKIAGLASRANFVELRSATGDTLTIVPGAQTYTSATLPSAPGTITAANTFAPVG